MAYTMEERLPFPTRPLPVHGGAIEEYIIPEDQKEEVLKQLYIFEDIPSMDEERFDLHEGKLFTVRDFKVVIENGHNFLVSPYYANSGGSVIDWMPAEWANEDETQDEDLEENEETIH
jgi:hypothetical protein